ncbi:MAG: TIGR02147 family protein [Pseudomonadota bacterium]
MEECTRQLLNSEYLRRKSSNSAYSQRAFARDLGVSKSLLNDVMNGYKSFSADYTKQILERLGMSPEEQDHFLNQESHSIAETEFEQLAQWYFFAILNLAELPEAQFCSRWVSERLCLDEAIVEDAMTHLSHLKLIEKTKRGKLKRTSQKIHADWQRSSRSLRNFHSENLKRTEQALFKVPFDERDLSTMMFSFPSDNFSEIKKECRRFQKRIASLSDKNKNANQVYSVNLQIIPQIWGEL